MTRRHDYHRHEFQPGRSDPSRRWAVSVKQPLAAMLATGRVRLLPKSEAPPEDLIGKRLVIHAGAGDVPYAHIREGAERKLRDAFGTSPKLLRPWLPRGMAIAEANLVGAFRIGRVIDGRAAYSPHAKHAAYYLGAWREFDGDPVLDVGEIEARWAWCLSEPAIVNERGVPLKGVGGVFDLEGVWREQVAEALQKGAAA